MKAFQLKVRSEIGENLPKSPFSRGTLNPVLPFSRGARGDF
jgi:hypothetical protein